MFESNVKVMTNRDGAAVNDPLMEKQRVRIVLDSDQVIIEEPPKFIGLTKEELEKYRDDPFWKRLRMFLFVMFILSWMAMFAAAIVIVVRSPACPPKFKPEWWQTKLCYQAWTPLFKDSDGDGKGDLGGLSGQLDTLNRVGVQAVWATPILKGSQEQPGFSVIDHTSVDASLGGNDAFQRVIDEAHSNGQYVIMDFPLSTTSSKHQWLRGDDFEEYYLIQDSKPNAEHWSKRADKKDTNSSSYYMHIFRKDVPVLNWDSDKVIQYMKESLVTWLEKGVDGFYLGHIEYLGRTEDGTQANWGKIAEKVKLVRGWVKEFMKESGKQIVLFSSSDEKDAHSNLVTEDGLDYVINKGLSQVSESQDPTQLALDIKNVIDPVVKEHSLSNISWPYWELGNPYSGRVCSRVSSLESCELLQMLLLCLPGAVNVYYGDEIGLKDLNKTLIQDIQHVNKNDWLESPQRIPMQWNSDLNAGFSTADVNNLTNANTPPVSSDYETINFESQSNSWRSMLKTFRKFADIRKRRESFYGGDMEINVQGPVVIFSRKPGIRAGELTYFGALNFGPGLQTIDLGIVGAEGIGEVVTVSSNMQMYTPRQKNINLNSFDLDSLSGLLIKHTPSE